MVYVFKQTLNLSKSIEIFEEKLSKDLSYLDELKKEYYLLDIEVNDILDSNIDSITEKEEIYSKCDKKLKKYNSSSFIETQERQIKLNKNKSSESLLNNSSPLQSLFKNGRSNVEDRYTYVRQHQMQRARNNGKENDMNRQKSLKYNINSCISDFIKLKNECPRKNEHFHKLIALNTQNYKNIFLDKKTFKFNNISNRLKIFTKRTLEESKSISFTIGIDKNHSLNAEKQNGGHIDKHTDKKICSFERKKLDNTKFNNKLRYLKLNYPKITNPIEQIVFENKFDKALFIYSISHYVSEKSSFFLNLYHIRNHTLFKDTFSLITDSVVKKNLKTISSIEEQLKRYYEDRETHQSIVNSFIPSKTAQNGLNFISFIDERHLAYHPQPSEIINIFKIMLLMMNEPFDEDNDENMIKYLVTDIYDRLGVDNIKSLFINHILKINYFSKEQIEKIVSITQKNPKVFFSSELLKINKTVSFFSFFLKEFYEYSFAKAIDGTYIFKLRKMHRKIKKLYWKIDFLKKNLLF